jgi:hypothetical protein
MPPPGSSLPSMVARRIQPGGVHVKGKTCGVECREESAPDLIAPGTRRILPVEVMLGPRWRSLIL